MTLIWDNDVIVSSYQYRKSHCGDKMVIRSSYLHSGISYTGKTKSLHWNKTPSVKKNWHKWYWHKWYWHKWYWQNWIKSSWFWPMPCVLFSSMLFFSLMTLSYSWMITTFPNACQESKQITLFFPNFMIISFHVISVFLNSFGIHVQSDILQNCCVDADCFLYTLACTNMILFTSDLFEIWLIAPAITQRCS